MNFQVDNIRIIEEEYLENFELSKKLSEVELCGLELALIKLLIDAEADLNFSYHLVDCYTRHLEDCLDILDGGENYLYVDCHKVLSIHLTVNGIPVLKCLKDECEYYDNSKDIYYATIG